MQKLLQKRMQFLRLQPSVLRKWVQVYFLLNPLLRRLLQNEQRWWSSNLFSLIIYFTQFTYSDCSCISDPNNPNVTLTHGACSLNCKKLIIFGIVIFLLNFFLFATYVPMTEITIRYFLFLLYYFLKIWKIN